MIMSYIRWLRCNAYLLRHGIRPISFQQWSRVATALRMLNDSELEQVVRTGRLP